MSGCRPWRPSRSRSSTSRRSGAASAPRIDAAIAAVLDHGGYIMGPEVGELEAQLAAFCGAKHVASAAPTAPTRCCWR